LLFVSVRPEADEHSVQKSALPEHLEHDTSQAKQASFSVSW